MASTSNANCLTSHDRRNYDRLSSGILVYADRHAELSKISEDLRAQISACNDYRRVLKGERGSRRSDQVLDMHESWVSRQIAKLTRELEPIRTELKRIDKQLPLFQVEYDRIEALMVAQLQAKHVVGVVQPTTVTVMDLDHKGPSKKPGRRYVPKGERKPATQPKLVKKEKAAKATKKGKNAQQRAA